MSYKENFFPGFIAEHAPLPIELINASPDTQDLLLKSHQATLAHPHLPKSVAYENHSLYVFFHGVMSKAKLDFLTLTYLFAHPNISDGAFALQEKYVDKRICILQLKGDLYAKPRGRGYPLDGLLKTLEFQFAKHKTPPDEQTQKLYFTGVEHGKHLMQAFRIQHPYLPFGKWWEKQ